MTGAATATPRGVRARRTDSSPSLISISARLDSSSRSMSFLILRRSMVGLRVVDGGRPEKRGDGLEGKSGQALERGVEGVAVAVGAEAADHADGEVAEVAGVAEWFAPVRVGQVHFVEGNGDCRQGVADGHAGVGERC